MTVLLQRYRGPWGIECRVLHPVTVTGRRWLAVLRVGPWSLILAERAS